MYADRLTSYNWKSSRQLTKKVVANRLSEWCMSAVFFSFYIASFNKVETTNAITTIVKPCNKLTHKQNKKNFLQINKRKKLRIYKLNIGLLESYYHFRLFSVFDNP